MSTVVRAVVRRAGRTLTTGVALGGLVATSLALDGAGERAVRRASRRTRCDRLRPRSPPSPRTTGPAEVARTTRAGG